MVEQGTNLLTEFSADLQVKFPEIDTWNASNFPLLVICK